jgi:CDGSH-type Zn-finger protein
VSRERPAEIRAYPDGPFLVRGPVTIVDGDGRSLSVRRAVVALCRCGRSRRQPLCDGTHTAAGFTCAGTAATGRTIPTLDLRSEPTTDGSAETSP